MSYLQELNKIAEELLAGGKGDNVPDSTLPKKQLEIGEAVEAEHTPNPKLRKEISKDHITEQEDYYTAPKEKNWGLHEAVQEGHMSKETMKKLSEYFEKTCESIKMSEKLKVAITEKFIKAPKEVATFLRRQVSSAGQARRAVQARGAASTAGGPASVAATTAKMPQHPDSGMAKKYLQLKAAKPPAPPKPAWNETTSLSKRLAAKPEEGPKLKAASTSDERTDAKTAALIVAVGDAAGREMAKLALSPVWPGLVLGSLAGAGIGIVTTSKEDESQRLRNALVGGAAGAALGGLGAALAESGDAILNNTLLSRELAKTEDKLEKAKEFIKQIQPFAEAGLKGALKVKGVKV